MRLLLDQQLKITTNSLEDYDDDNDKFCLFASDLQLSHLEKQLDQVFIDGYFKVPKPFYQLITIYIFDKKH